MGRIACQRGALFLGDYDTAKRYLKNVDGADILLPFASLLKVMKSKRKSPEIVALFAREPVRNEPLCVLVVVDPRKRDFVQLNYLGER
jgi:hypothetical protein